MEFYDPEPEPTVSRGPSPDHALIRWGNKSISLVGLHTVVVLILTIALTWLGYLLERSVTGTQTILREAIEEHTKQQSAEHIGMSDDIRRNFGRMSTGQDHIAEAMDAQTYLLTKTDKERQLYKLDMPESLRRRIR